MGAEQAEGRGRVRGRSPLQCHSSPRRRVRTHARTHSHTLARARAQAGTSVWLGSAEQTRPTPSVAPRPRATPPALHPLKAIGCRGGAALGERAARATLPALHRRSRATVGESAAGGGAQPRLARSAPGDQPEAVAGCGLLDPTTGSRGGAGTGRRARRYLLAQPAGWRAGGRADRREGYRGALSGVAAGDTLGCLEGAAGGEQEPRRPRRKPLVTAPTLGAPPILFSLHFFTPVPTRSWFSRLRPNPCSQRTQRRLMPAMSLLFWDQSVSAALFPPQEGRSPGAA